MRRAALFLFINLAIGGCFPNKFDYRHMSFEDMPEIKILAYGKAKVHNLSSHEPMPVLYALYREKYTLLIEIDLDSYPPASFVKAESNELEGQDLRVGGLARGSWCSRFDSYVVGAKTGEFLRYVWGGGRSAECSNREFSAEERTFTLRIVDEADNFLGEEILAFTIVKNGSFIEYDSL